MRRRKNGSHAIPDLAGELIQTIRPLLHWNAVDLACRHQQHSTACQHTENGLAERGPWGYAMVLDTTAHCEMLGVTQVDLYFDQLRWV